MKRGPMSAQECLHTQAWRRGIRERFVEYAAMAPRPADFPSACELPHMSAPDSRASWLDADGVRIGPRAAQRTASPFRKLERHTERRGAAAMRRMDAPPGSIATDWPMNWAKPGIRILLARKARINAAVPDARRRVQLISKQEA